MGVQRMYSWVRHKGPYSVERYLRVWWRAESWVVWAMVRRGPVAGPAGVDGPGGAAPVRSSTPLVKEAVELLHGAVRVHRGEPSSPTSAILR